MREKKLNGLKIIDVESIIKNSAIGLADIRKIQHVIANQVNEKAQAKQDRQQEPDVVDYYEKYGIERGEDSKVVYEKLKKMMRLWINRQNSTTPSDQETLKKVQKEIEQLDEALRIFDPQNKQLLQDYDERLSQRETGKAEEEAVVDYYEEFGIQPGEDWESIRKKIGSQLAEWHKNKGNVNVNNPKSKALCDNMIEQLRKARILFSPGHEEELRTYNDRLSQSRRKKKIHESAENMPEVDKNGITKTRNTGIKLSAGMER